MTPEEMLDQRLRRAGAERRRQVEAHHDPHLAYRRFNERGERRTTPPPWLLRVALPALAAAAVILGIVAIATRGGDGDDGQRVATGGDDATETPEPDPTDGAPIVPDPSGEPTPGEAPTEEPTPEPTEPPATPTPTPTPDPTVVPVGGGECDGNRYSLGYPTGWFTPDAGTVGHCVFFSTAPLDVQPGTDLVVEIDVVLGDELFDLALQRIRDDATFQTIVSETPATAGRQRAVVFDVVTSGAGLLDAGTRQHLWVVDMGDTTLFAAATDIAAADGTSSYGDYVATLDQMMAGAALAAAATPACVPPLPAEARTDLGDPVYFEMNPDVESHLELAVPIGTNASGTNWGLYTEVGCSWVQVAELAEHASAATFSGWGCEVLEDGVHIMTVDSTFVDQPTGYEITIVRWSLQGTSLDEVDSQVVTNPSGPLPPGGQPQLGSQTCTT